MREQAPGNSFPLPHPPLLAQALVKINMCACGPRNSDDLGHWQQGAKTVLIMENGADREELVIPRQVGLWLAGNQRHGWQTVTGAQGVRPGAWTPRAARSHRNIPFPSLVQVAFHPQTPGKTSHPHCTNGVWCSQERSPADMKTSL